MNSTLPKEVILTALRCCRDVYPHKQDFLVDRSQAGHTILAVEGTNEKTDWITNLKFLIRRDDCHRNSSNHQDSSNKQILSSIYNIQLFHYVPNRKCM